MIINWYKDLPDNVTSPWEFTFNQKRQVKRKTRKWLIKHYKFGFIVRNEIPLFSSIEIETINRCNNDCPFCPVNKNVDSRQYKMMEESLFYKIIDELGEINYSGRLSLSSNNEPLLDNRIEKFAEYARKKVPNAFLYLYTNGILLDVDRTKNIVKNLNKIYIDNYDDELKLNETNQKIQIECELDNELNSKIEIHLRKKNEILTTRGGLAPNNTKKEPLYMSCILPFKQVVIRPDGKVSLCCADALGKYTLGDVSKESIKEIWNGKAFREIRKKLNKGRKNIDLCHFCDNLQTPDSY